MTWLFYLVIAVCYFLCGFVALRQALHMFQLNSYQDLSYTNYLRANKKAFWNAKRKVPAAMMLLGGLSLASMPWFFAAATANRIGPRSGQSDRSMVGVPSASNRNSRSYTRSPCRLSGARPVTATEAPSVSSAAKKAPLE